MYIYKYDLMNEIGDGITWKVVFFENQNIRIIQRLINVRKRRRLNYTHIYIYMYNIYNILSSVSALH